MSISNKELREHAIQASLNSYSPYSKAKVGSALITDSGEVFSGCNIENSSFGGTVCAERVAIWKAISTKQQKIEKIYVYTQDGWPPCGLCLQVLSEFSTPNTTVVIGDSQGNETQTAFSELFPKAFTPGHLKNS